MAQQSTRIILAAALLAVAIPLGANRNERPVYAVNLDPVSIYDLAEYATGAPAEILRGIAFAESSERDDAIGDGGESIGRFQFRRVYQAERDARYGALDPRDPVESAILAGLVYMDNLLALGSVELAIAAHRQGVAGVRRDGASDWYVEWVMGVVL